LIAARREFVVPLLPDLTRGGSAECYGAEVVQVRWQARARVLTLAAKLSSHRVDIPEPHGRTIWSEGETVPALGPWSVRWTLA
jgi:maltooligosyltrehalose trehalohydrolase